MDEEIRMDVMTVDLESERFDLILQASEGPKRCWKKRYDGIVFLSFDARSLNLLERVTGGIGPSPLRFKQQALLKPHELKILDFTSVDPGLERKFCRDSPERYRD